MSLSKNQCHLVAETAKPIALPERVRQPNKFCATPSMMAQAACLRRAHLLHFNCSSRYGTAISLITTIPECPNLQLAAAKDCYPWWF